MNLEDIKLSQDDIDKLKAKVLKEKTEWIRHIENKVQQKRAQMDKLLQKPTEEGTIKSHKVWKNLNLRKAIFLRDKIDVKLIQDNGALWMKLANNANKVMEFDSIDMDFRADREEIITWDAMTGLSAVMIDGYDEEIQQPIRTVVNSLTCYGDPRNWRGSLMRYFGTQIEKNVDDLIESTWYFNLDKIKESESASSKELEDFQRARNSANGTTHIYSKEWLIHIINHITSFNGKLYLTTWDIDCNVLFRIIELRELSKKEKLRPGKINLWVTLYRGKPIPFSFFGASLFDEIEQYQDLDTLLVNLQVRQAQRVGLWPNKYMHSGLWLDIDQIINKPIAGATLEYAPDIMYWDKLNASNGIFVEPQEQISRFPNEVRGIVGELVEETTWYNQNLPFGNSIGWSQTKAEVQTLQQNINEQIGLIWDNYLDSDKNYYISHMRCYALNMPNTASKVVVLFENDKQDSYSFKKKDFVPNWNIQVYVTSKVQEDIRDKQDFAVLSTVIQTLLPNLEQWSTKFLNTMRMYLDKAWVKWLKWIDIFPLSKDERKAQIVIEAINNDEYDRNSFWPQPWEDYGAIVELLEQAIDNSSKIKAIIDYETARDKTSTQQPVRESAVWNAQSGAMTSNMLASQQNQNPSLSSINI